MMVVWFLILIGFFGVLAFAAFRRVGDGGQDPAAAQQPIKTARQRLDERLATGEIDTDEHQRRRAALEAPDRAGVAS